MGNKHIFVSYSSSDAAMTRRIVQTLEGRGLTCWMAPRDVPPGANFGAAIVDAIENAYAMVLVFSANANQRAEEIKKEIVLASQANLVVVPARIENLVPSDGAFRYELSTRQWIDLFDNWDQGIDRLAAHLERLGPGAAARDGMPAPPPSPRQPVLGRVASRRTIAAGAGGAVVAAAVAGAWGAGLFTSTPTVGGVWQSDFGPVTLVQTGFKVSGAWQQAQGVGQIVNGTFDAKDRQLDFTYTQTWNRAQGRAVLTLSPDGRSLSGTWTQRGEDGLRNGSWVMRR